MTHKDIYTKFMIEYDKANVTSSYPSLTEYEVATVLDKAYNALIAQKVTGNNPRRTAFESDMKAISDITPLIVTEQLSKEGSIAAYTNVVSYPLNKDFLYFVEGHVTKELDATPIDGEVTRPVPVQLVNHQIAKSFFASSYNLPWIKNPVCYIENKHLYLVYDPYKIPQTDNIYISYIKTPNKFAKDLDSDVFANISGSYSYFDLPTEVSNGSGTTIVSPGGSPIIPGTSTGGTGGRIDDLAGDTEDLTALQNLKKAQDLYIFECNDTVAEELISLAIAFALENVESPRLNSKLNMRGLEA